MADVILNITVPEAWIAKVLNAFNKITSTDMVIESQNVSLGVRGRWDFVIEDKSPAENNKQFGERVLRELGKAVVKMVDLTEDTERYKAEISAVASPVSDVDDNILI